MYIYIIHTHIYIYTSALKWEDVYSSMAKLQNSCCFFPDGFHPRICRTPIPDCWATGWHFANQQPPGIDDVDDAHTFFRREQVDLPINNDDFP